VAKVFFNNKTIGAIKDISGQSFSTNISQNNLKVLFKEKSISASRVFQSDKRYARFSYTRVNTTPKEVLPFRVRFTNIGVIGYSAQNPAPIGIAVIGLSNYIL
jgi:hypothetical protein